jgi:hypothetical protein
MYQSYRIQQMQAAASMTAAERHVADEQVGRIAADLSWLGQQIAGRARILAKPLQATWSHVTLFEIHGSESCAENATTTRC